MLRCIFSRRSAAADPAHPWLAWSVLPGLIVLLLLSACSNDQTASNDVTYSSIAPILEQRCASCHEQAGPGAPHLVLDTAGSAAENAEEMRLQVLAGVMPPWPASTESIAFANSRALTAGEREALLAWFEAGAPLDVAPETVIEQTGPQFSLTEADRDLAPLEPYDGSVEEEDEYRCLVYDPKVTAPEWLTGYEFVPDQTEIVHHAIGYRVPASAAEQVRALDDADPGSGWNCDGSSRVNQEEFLIGWAPGQGASRYPDGAALALQPGDQFIVQIHYHEEQDTPADASRLLLETTPEPVDVEVRVGQYVAPVEIPCLAEESGPLCARDAAMEVATGRFGPEGVPADGINLLCGTGPSDFADDRDGFVSSSCDQAVKEFGTIISVLGHQHEIGTSFRLTLNPDTTDAVVLLDIPRWSFDWQYNYEPAEPIVVSPGDRLRVECSWNRALRDADLEPSYILWANGTNDEMCFSTVAVAR